MTPLYPLVFRPVFKRYLWGGRRLGTMLGKAIGEGNDYAESWEIADHEHGQSIVANGPLAGMSLHELVMTRGQELLGRHHPQSRFPLIFKYLDCQHDLSVQVHPDDAAAAKLTPPDLGKTEAWVVLHAEPGSRIYAGLKPGCDNAKLRAAVAQGHVEQWLHSFEPRSGDCIFISAGTIHALGAGLLVGEIQQASDTTYRLHDWNRVGADGKPRPLHIDQSLDAIDYSAVDITPQRPDLRGPAECLVTCDKFVLNRWTLTSATRFDTNNSCRLVSILDGEVLISSPSGPVSLGCGQTVLLPACLGHVELRPRGPTTLLEARLPDTTLQPRAST
jgi:mannose-6-phosphate isomerase